MPLVVEKNTRLMTMARHRDGQRGADPGHLELVADR